MLFETSQKTHKATPPLLTFLNLPSMTTTVNGILLLFSLKSMVDVLGAFLHIGIKAVGKYKNEFTSKMTKKV